MKWQDESDPDGGWEKIWYNEETGKILATLENWERTTVTTVYYGDNKKQFISREHAIKWTEANVA